MSTNPVSTNPVSTNPVSTNPVSTNPDDHSPPSTRQCSRCRVAFPLDDTLLFSTEYAWWLCPTCSSALLGKPSK
jgi:hypothetical protein